MTFFDSLPPRPLSLRSDVGIRVVMANGAGDFQDFGSVGRLDGRTEDGVLVQQFAFKLLLNP